MNDLEFDILKAIANRMHLQYAHVELNTMKGFVGLLRKEYDKPV